MKKTTIALTVAVALSAVWLVYNGMWDCRSVGEIHGEWCKAVTVGGTVAAFVPADHGSVTVYATR